MIIENNIEIVAPTAILFILLCYWIIKKVTTPVASEEVPTFTEGLSELSEPKIKAVTESRYVEKKASRTHKDVNRWGRWRCTLTNGKEVTRMGQLSNVIKADVKSYREIK